MQTYVPTVFENYTACLASEEQRVELSLWDTSGTGGTRAVHVPGAPVALEGEPEQPRFRTGVIGGVGGLGFRGCWLGSRGCSERGSLQWGCSGILGVFGGPAARRGGGVGGPGGVSGVVFFGGNPGGVLWSLWWPPWAGFGSGVTSPGVGGSGAPKGGTDTPKGRGGHKGLNPLFWGVPTTLSAPPRVGSGVLRALLAANCEDFWEIPVLPFLGHPEEFLGGGSGQPCPVLQCPPPRTEGGSPPVPGCHGDAGAASLLFRARSVWAAKPLRGLWGVGDSRGVDRRDIPDPPSIPKSNPSDPLPNSPPLPAPRPPQSRVRGWRLRVPEDPDGEGGDTECPTPSSCHPHPVPGTPGCCRGSPKKGGGGGCYINTAGSISSRSDATLMGLRGRRWRFFGGGSQSCVPLFYGGSRAVSVLGWDL